VHGVEVARLEQTALIEFELDLVVRFTVTKK
jgi:hypothetical protein